jgi:tRNA modification GTPase
MAEGLTLAIVGRANVGKSTLFNALLEENRAIVSRFPGTTRDYLRERIKLGDAVFHLVDMAGLEGASHPVEKEGVRRGEKIAARADGVLLVLDASRPESRADLRLLKKFGDKKAILILNKCDLPRKMDEDVVRRTVPAGVPYVEISALKGTHLDRLRGLIRKTFAPSQQPSDDVILHQRQKLLLEQVVKGLAGALQLLRQGHSEEICAEEIRGTVRIFGQLTGEIRAEDIIESIFSRFCVGK